MNKDHLPINLIIHLGANPNFEITNLSGGKDSASSCTQPSNTRSIRTVPKGQFKDYPYSFSSQSSTMRNDFSSGNQCLNNEEQLFSLNEGNTTLSGNYNLCYSTSKDATQAQPTRYTIQTDNSKTTTTNNQSLSNQPVTSTLKAHQMNGKTNPNEAQQQPHLSPSTEAFSIEEVIRQLFPGAKVICVSYDEQNNLTEDTRSEDNQSKCPVHESKEEEPALDINDLPEFINTVVNQFESIYQEQARRSEEAMEDRITANVLRVLKDYINYKGEMDAAKEVNDYNEALEEESTLYCPSGCKPVKYPTRESPVTDNSNFAENNCSNPSVDEQPFNHRLTNDDTPLSETSMRSLNLNEVSGNGVLNSLETEQTAEGMSTSIKDMENRITTRVIQFVGNSLVNNLTGYIDILLDAGLRNIERHLIERLTDRIDYRCKTSVQNFLSDSIEKGLGDSACQTLVERISANIADNFYEYLHEDLVDYVTNQTMLAAKVFISEEVEERVEECFKERLRHYEDELRFDPESDLEEDSDYEKRHGYTMRERGRTPHYEVIYSKKDSESKSHIDEYWDSYFDNPCTRGHDAVGSENNCPSNDAFSANQSELDTMENDQTEDNIYGYDNYFEEYDSFGEDETFDDTDGQAEYYSEHRQMDDHFTFTGEMTTHKMKDDLKELGFELGREDNSALYPETPNDDDYIEEEEDDDPYDDNDDLWDDEQLMGRLKDGYRRREELTELEIFQKEVRKKLLARYNLDESTSCFIDPYSGQIVIPGDEYVNPFDTDNDQYHSHWDDEDYDDEEDCLNHLYESDDEDYDD